MSRISVDEAARLWNDASDDELRVLAGAARAQWHEPDRATYMVMRIINYTNVCVAQCDYCAFYVLPGQDGGYVLDRDEVFAKIDGLLEVGGDLVAFNGGFNPKLPLDYYCDLFAAVRERYQDTRRVLRAHGGGVHVPRRPGRPLVRGDGGAPPRRGRLLGDGRRQRDPDRGLPQAPCQVQVHRRPVLRGAARDRRERHAHHGDDGDRLRRDARGAARASAADARLPGRLHPRRATPGCSRSSPGRTSRTARRSAAGRSRRPSTGATSRSRASSSTTSSTSGRRC